MAEARASGGSSAGSPRDLAASALILGVATLLWFGWAQAQPPAGWSVPLTAGSVAGVAIAAAVTGARSTVAPSFLAGAGGGAVCLAGAVFCVQLARRQPLL